MKMVRLNENPRNGLVSAWAVPFSFLFLGGGYAAFRGGFCFFSASSSLLWRFLFSGPASGGLLSSDGK
jgi:hypothetical protein